MSYIGTPPSNAFTSLLKQDFSTSATTGYTLDHAVNNANDIALFINFVRQEPTAAYAASGTTLTLTSATASSDDMYCVYLGQALQTVNPANASVGLSQLTATGTKDATTFLRGDNTFAAAQGKFESQLLHVRDEKSSGTPAGNATGGAQMVRVLNTVKTNEITGASLSSNQITLPSGTYYIKARAPSFMTNNNKIYLYNVTDSSNEIIGSSSYCDTTYQVAGDSTLFGRFTISAQKVFELKHDFNASRNSNGLGVETSLSGVIEVYAEVQIWKVA